MPNASIEIAGDEKIHRDTQCIVSELCKTDLFDVIASNGHLLQEPELLMGLFSQVLEAVNATHKAKMCHADIKLENILVAFDHSLRLCDYGFAKSLQMPLSGVRGTPTYMAPEIIAETYDYDGEKADIFSLGVLLYVMAFGQPPFECADTKECKYWRMMYTSP